MAYAARHPASAAALGDIDLLGTFNVLRVAVAVLRKPGASIINISAPHSSLPTVAQVHVCAARAGVDMVTRAGPKARSVMRSVLGEVVVLEESLRHRRQRRAEAEQRRGAGDGSGSVARGG